MIASWPNKEKENEARSSLTIIAPYKFQREEDRGKIDTNSGRRFGLVSCNGHIGLQSQALIMQPHLPQRRSLSTLLIGRGSDGALSAPAAA